MTKIPPRILGGISPRFDGGQKRPQNSNQILVTRRSPAPEQLRPVAPDAAGDDVALFVSRAASLWARRYIHHEFGGQSLDRPSNIVVVQSLIEQNIRFPDAPLGREVNRRVLLRSVFVVGSGRQLAKAGALGPSPEFGSALWASVEFLRHARALPLVDSTTEPNPHFTKTGEEDAEKSAHRVGPRRRLGGGNFAQFAETNGIIGLDRGIRPIP